MSVEAGVGIGAGVGAGSSAPTLNSFGPKFESLAYSPIDRVVRIGEFENMNDFKILRFVPSIKEDTSIGESIAKEIWTELTKQEDLTTDVLERALKARAAVQPKEKVVPGILIELQPQPEPGVAAPRQAEAVYPVTSSRVHSRVSNEAQTENPLKTYGIEIVPGEEATAQRVRVAEDMAIERTRIVRDSKALSRRIADGLEAVKKAFIRGEDVQIPNEYDEVKSGALKESRNEEVPDGSYEVYKEKAEKRLKAAKSSDEMAKIIEEEAYNNEPVTREGSLSGKRVTQEAVYREKTIHEYPDLAEALQAA